ncbi:hypothetical protein AOLI_G00192230 [Acnodon oligacanthus]
MRREIPGVTETELADESTPTPYALESQNRFFWNRLPISTRFFPTLILTVRRVLSVKLQRTSYITFLAYIRPDKTEAM